MDKDQQQTIEQLAEHFRAIIELIGDDPQREGLIKTPMRAAKALYFITEGYRQRPAELIRQAIFEYSGSQIVVVKDIEFYSMCEHHILPFFGRVSIGYIPRGEMVGLSKLARVVNACARKLQVQERLTAQIAAEVDAALANGGVIVKCEAQHLCMMMRGVEKQGASTATIEYTGAFAADPALRAQFFSML